MTEKQAKKIIEMVDEVTASNYRAQDEFPRIEVTYRDWLSDGNRYVAEYLKSHSDYFVVAEGNLQYVRERAHKALNKYPVLARTVYYTWLSHQKHLKTEVLFPGVVFSEE